jgi:copper(I)-binding protein
MSLSKYRTGKFREYIVLVSVFVATAIFSQTVWSAGIMVDKAWSLPLPAVSKNGAAYFSIQNHGSVDKLISASSDIAEQVQFHTIIHIDGQMKMQQLEAVEIPMHGSVHFEPGGMHIMLFGLKEQLEEGNFYSLKLNFEKAGEVDVTVMVQMNAEGGLSGDHSNHTDSSD